MTRPVTYEQAAALPFPDVLMRWQELEQRDIISGCDGEDAPPLTMDEYLELLALGEVCARHFMQASRIQRAVTAGASWGEIRAALARRRASLIISWLPVGGGWKVTARSPTACKTSARP